MYKVYKNDVYPFCLVVGNMSDLDEINKEYETWDRKDIEQRKNSAATTRLLDYQWCLFND